MLIHRIHLAAVLFASLLIASSLATTARAQSTWIGVRAGLSLAGQSVDSTLEASSTGLRTGFLAGVEADHWFSPMIGLGVQLLYDQKGTHHEYAEGSVAHPNLSGTVDIKSNYLEIPILLKVAFYDADVQPYAFAGPSVGILMSATETSNLRSESSVDYKSSMSSTDVSIYFGLGVQAKLTYSSALVVDAGYAAGLTKVYTGSLPTDEPNRAGNPNSKSTDFRFGVGYLFKL